MARQKVFTLLSLLLVVAAFGVDRSVGAEEVDDQGSGEVAEEEIVKSIVPKLESNPEEADSDSDQSEAPLPPPPSPETETETSQTTQPPSVAVGVDSEHLPREEEEEEEQEKEEQEQEQQHQQPLGKGNDGGEIVHPESRSTEADVVTQKGDVPLWDGNDEVETSDAERKHGVGDAATGVNQPKQPPSQERLGDAGVADEGQRDGSDAAAEEEAVRSSMSQDGKSNENYDTRSSANSGSVRVSSLSSSSFVWLVVFGVIGSSFLISGMNDLVSDDSEPWCFSRHCDMKDFNPYAWLPVQSTTNQKSTALHPLT